MESIFQIDYDRLKRHHDVCIEKYDQISLLDLSHALRMWADLKGPLMAIPEFSQARVFQRATPTKETLTAVKGKKFIFASFPGGVTTKATLMQEIAGPPRTIEDRQYGIHVAAKPGLDTLTLFQYSFLAAKTENNQDISREKVYTCNYKDWLEQQAVLVCFVNSRGILEERVISRNDLIRRAANVLNASHPAAASTSDRNQPIDPAIRFLAKVPTGDIPLLYLALLKTSQDILEFSPPLLGINTSPPSLVHSDAVSMDLYAKNFPRIRIPPQPTYGDSKVPVKFALE